MPESGMDAITEMARNGQLENIFSTPVFSHVLQDVQSLNAQLRDLILERETTGHSAVRSNQGGWQSEPDFFRWDAPPIAALQQYVGHAINIATVRVTGQPKLKFQMELYGWATVNRHGHYNSVHVHPMATWSGVYYVDPGDENPETRGGLLEFVHPIAASAMTFFPNVLPSARVVQPKEGMVIMFPSYLQHGVRVYRGERPRISIPFNAHLRLAE
jgi:uncharacterized protein (TIGR02466 family)